MTKQPVSSRSRPTTPSQKKPKSTRSTMQTTTRKSRTPKPPEKPETVLPNFLKKLLEDPDAIRNLRQHLPAWTDELLAVILIVSSAVAFASLLNAGGEGELASKLSTALRQGFGGGAYLVALAVLVGGFIILLPKIGVQITFSWGRLVALEMTFLCFQGLLHIAEFETETRALAREGKGGGYIGWAVSNLLVGVFGSRISLVIVSIGLVVGIHWLLRIRRHHYHQIFIWISNGIQNLASRLDPPPIIKTAPLAAEPAIVEQMPVVVAAPEPVSEPLNNRPSLVPRPTNGTSALTAQPQKPAAPIRKPAAPPVSPPPDDPPEVSSDSEGEIERPALMINGQAMTTLLQQRERPSIVPRSEEPEKKPVVLGKMPEPKRIQGGRDGDPKKRYFRIEDFKERIKLTKRDESLPPLELLGKYDQFRPDEDEINRNASIIENTLLEFDID
ncbi:MAG: hypothetical protein K8I82_16850, partial [Anaerolineae bacterium]|nr:hypothetical protein [Anaerolineae bacterium]